MKQIKLNKPVFKSLGSKVFVSFALLFSLSLALIFMVEMLGIPNGFIKGKIQNNRIEALQKLNLIADLEKDRLLEWVYERKVLAKILAENIFLDHEAQAILENKLNHNLLKHQHIHIREHFSQILSIHKVYDSIAIVNMNSRKIIVSSNKDDEGKLLNDQKAIQLLEQLEINEHIALTQRKNTQEYDLIIMRKIKAVSAANLIIVLRINTDKIMAPLLRVGNMLGQTGDIVVVDNQAKVLFALKHRSTDMGRYYAKTRKVARMAVSGEEGFSLRKDHRDIETLSAYRHLVVTPELAWGLVVKQDYAEITQPLWNSFYTTLYSALVLLLVALILVYWMSKRLTYPLAVLTQTIKRVKAGHLSERVTIYNQDDIGSLGLTFNAMLEEIENQQKLLNDTVEQQVNTIKHGEQRIHELAFYDILTELPNRNLLINQLDKSIARAKRNNDYIALLLLDIDNFKIINESISHKVGDQLLQQIALKLSALIRKEDSVARTSGDEFIVLLDDLATSKGTVIKNAEKIALKIQHELSKVLVIQEKEISITITIGIVLFPDDGHSSSELLKAADIALYRAKALGRESIQFFAPEMKLIAEQRLAIETDLRQALTKQQFEIYFQPQVDVKTGHVSGAEALLRWNHPIEGLVSPTKFIPIAEETQLIIPIGTWVLQSVCQAIKQWENEGYFSAHFSTIAVNVSAIQFQQDNFVNIVQKALQESVIDPSHLEIELTESLFVGDYETTRSKLNNLKQLGICLTIDDFGTGYSSLSYLKMFPLDVLKIDRSFVMDIATDPNDAAIVKAITVMANTLKLRVLAEGVETEEQLEFIRKVGCENYQGYLYSKPIKVQEFVELLKKRR